MFYQRMGKIPQKRHVVFRKEDGSLYREQVMGTKGFSGIQSILYHHNPPTAMVEAELLGEFKVEYEEDRELAPRHFLTDKFERISGDAVNGRQYILGNDDLLMGVAYPNK